MSIVLARLGSPEHVGQFALGLALTAPIFMFATLRLRDVQATDTRQEYQFGDYFALRLLTTVLAFLTVGGIVIVTDYDRETALVILGMGLSKSAEAISDAFYGLFTLHERMDRSAKSLILKGPLMLLGLGLGFYLTDSVFWGVIGLVLARVSILLTYDLRNTALMLDPSTRLVSYFFPSKFPKPRWDANTLRRLTWMTLPLGFVTMLISYKTNIPRYFVEAHLGVYYLGIFSALDNFQKTNATFILAVGRSTSPRLARYYAERNVTAFRKLLLRMIYISLTLGGVGVLAAWVAGPQIITLIYGPEYVVPGLFILVMITAGIDNIATMLHFGMTAARYFKVQLPVFAMTTGSVAIAAYFLVPEAGMVGASLALIIGISFRAIGSLIAVVHAIRRLQASHA